MASSFVAFGETCDLSSEALSSDIARRMMSVLLRQKDDFEIIELRRLSRGNGKMSDVIVVDCVNDQVPTHNPIGIKVRERLALVFTPHHLPEVRALRQDFPRVLHRNHVLPNEPSSLCLYFEPWSAIERSWTPENFLQRILWWLRETAKGTLHRADQPPEQIYYDSPFKVVLPPDFHNKIVDESLSLVLGQVPLSSGGFKIIRGTFEPKGKAQGHKLQQTEVLWISLSAIVHGPVEMPPNTMGEVHDQLEGRGSPFLTNLIEEIRSKTPDHGLERAPLTRCLLVLGVPVKRTEDAAADRYEIRAFQTTTDLAGLGEATGALTLHERKFYAVNLLEGAKGEVTNAWRELPVLPIDVRYEADSEFSRKASEVTSGTADFKGVLAGVGSLGATIACLWAKESWGEWAFVDDDIVEPHNTVRHIAVNGFIGEFKVDAVKEIVGANYHPGYYKAAGIPDSVLNIENALIQTALSEAGLLVDATTTVEVLREWSCHDGLSRSASVFMTPSGSNSVLFFEAADRSIRLDCLEAQYYRAIIYSGWGANLLKGNRGALWIGAGCRDISAVISYEVVQLHAAILARQVRLLHDHPEPHIRIWCGNTETGAVTTFDIRVQKSLRNQIGEWLVVWDVGTQSKLAEVRNAHLPNETGGVILGYIDQKLRIIYIVDVLQAPPDSQSSPAEFIRGVEGLEATLEEIARRTARVVGYIGEWHSHPAFTSAFPSQTDQALIASLASTLALDGQPALMMIVGSTGEISLSVKSDAC